MAWGAKAVGSSHEESQIVPVLDRSAGTQLLGVRVVGMHRSGTSFVAGAFARGGYFVGSDDKRLPPDPDNQPGYFERRDLVELDDRMLGSFGGSWWQPPSVEAVVAGQARFVGAAADLLTEIRTEAGARPIVLKDPRMACLMPVWDPVVGSQFLDVLVLRNPIDVARSLARRNGFPVQYSLALWEVHLSGLLRSLAGRPVVTVNFSALAADDGPAALTAALTRAFDRLGIPRPEFGAFTATQRHFFGPETDLLAVATPSQMRLWKYLSDLLLFEPHLIVPPELASPSEAANKLLDEVGHLLRQVPAGRTSERPAPPVEQLAAMNRECGLRDALSIAHRSAAAAHEQLVTLLERAAADSVAKSSLVNKVIRLQVELDALRSEADALSSRVAALLAEGDASRAERVTAEERLRELLAVSRQQRAATEVSLHAAERETERLRDEQAEFHGAWTRREAWLSNEREEGQALIAEALLRVAAAEGALRRSETASLEMVAESERLHTSNVALRTEMSRVLASRSWRMTRALRWVMYRARGGRSRLPSR